jgi:AcrR family transcriptional regulator
MTADRARGDESMRSEQSAPRRRDAAASRERLLLAAAELFADRGFDQTTARDIGQRAGVDPAMIARYFGGKAQLYIAVLRDESGPDAPPAFLEPERLAGLVRRTDELGAGPIFQAALRPYDDPTAQEAASQELIRRIVDPVRAQLSAKGVDDARLRAEVLTAALIGVTLARRTGVLPALASARTDDVVALLEELLGVE